MIKEQFLKRRSFDIHFYDDAGKEIGNSINECVSDMVDMDMFSPKALTIRVVATPSCLHELEMLPGHFKTVVTFREGGLYGFTINRSRVTQTKIHKVEDNPLLMLDVYFDEELLEPDNEDDK